jgi:hypothetical protein
MEIKISRKSSIERDGIWRTEKDKNINFGGATDSGWLAGTIKSHNFEMINYFTLFTGLPVYRLAAC